MTTTALVTGGAGFIGSHLAERLLALGHRVRVLDDLSTSTLDNVAHLRSHPAFDCVVGSVMDRELLAELVAGADVVFHLAAAVGVQLIVDSPVRTIETNVRGTENLLELACARRTPVLITSTSEVYGKSSRLPFSEDDDLVLGPPTRGRWAYACSKALDEFLALAYFHERGLPVCIARLFNTVGPRQSARYGMVLPRFVGQALAGAPLTVHGDGTQSRCFCDVDDVVWALTRLAANDAAWGQVFNVGSREEITILELARRVRDWLGSPSEVTFVPYAEAYGRGFEDIARRVPDLSKIHQLIGFEPRTPLARIVERIADHHRLAA